MSATNPCQAPASSLRWPMPSQSPWTTWSETKKWRWRASSFARKVSQASAKRCRSKPKSCTCWNATSWSRSFSACRASTGTSPAKLPYPVINDPSEADHVPPIVFAFHWDLGLDPIPNLVELMEERGIKVLSCDLGNIDGLMARVRRARQEHRARPSRQRATIGGSDSVSQWLTSWGIWSWKLTPKVDDETAAFRFAGAFLMPAEVLWAAMGKHRTSIGWSELFALKKLFGVSVQALTYRCKDLGIFGRPLFQRLFHEFSRLGWRKPPYQEPYAMPGEEPQRFERLCFRALAEGRDFRGQGRRATGNLGPRVEPAHGGAARLGV